MSRRPTWCLTLALALAAVLPLAARGQAGDDGPPADPDPWARLEPQLLPLDEATQPGQASAALAGDQSLSQPSEPAGPQIDRPEGRPVQRRGAAVRPSPGAASDRPNAEPSWVRTLGSLAAVVALIGLLAWGYRVTLQRGGIVWNGTVRRPGLIQVLSRLTLGPRQSLCLVRVGPRTVLLGLTGERITALDVVHDAALTAELAGEAERVTAGPKDAFAAALQKEDESFDQLTAGEPLPPEAKLRGLQTDLVGTLRKLRRAAGMP